MKLNRLATYTLGLALIGGLSLTTVSCKKKGCTDDKATNFDSKAKKDDGSCEYPKPTVTTPSKPTTTGLKMITSGYAIGAQAKIELYAKEDLFVGYNYLYVAAYDSVSGEVLTDGHIKLMPHMAMNSGMMHAAPAESPHGESANDDKLFPGQVLFLMPSNGGTWKLNVKFHNHKHHKDGMAELAINVVQPTNRLMVSFKDTTSSDSTSIFLAYALPEKPKVGSNELKITAFYKKSMMEFPAKEDLTIEFVPSMPSMGHGSPNNEHPSHQHHGHYVGKVNYTMTGKWKLALKVMRNGKVINDQVFFEYTL